ncbi:helicase HerA-like domain-containing protein [Thiofilum flexile]|uniref:helicase HerA-like domain-containing protein n=1 Tax=Thiofilum flexile TaxID=125627 RepID=UPI000373A4D6|nr:helicase HerA-like domain-containing protein [Thiofilum flexile]
MTETAGILLGQGDERVYLNPRFANRHGLIAGATGTGKTVSLQVLAESFSRLGVPVFMADIKGDLTGISQPGRLNTRVEERLKQLGIQDHTFEGCPTVIWDLTGERGHPIRTTISEMGPLLLARLLELNDTQEGILNIAFKLADDEGILLLDMKDLRAMLQYLGENASQFQNSYGTISSASIGAIQRRLLVLEQQGGEKFFGEPAINLLDFIRTDARGYGQVNILAADRLVNSPKLYSTFLLWMLSELFETLPEVGDLDKPKLVFFFDEAHLLFTDAPKSLVTKVEQVVKLIRSKGVGVYFITQTPLDIPESVLGQLGNRVQHALRAFTPRDQKAVKTAAETFRANPKLNTAQVIMEMGVGEALVSTLQDNGTPSVVQRTLITPPHSQIGPIDDATWQALLRSSPYAGRYDVMIDRESAYEVLQARAQQVAAQAQATKEQKPTRRQATKETSLTDSLQEVGEAFAKNLARSAGTKLGQQIMRGILGSIFK